MRKKPTEHGILLFQVNTSKKSHHYNACKKPHNKRRWIKRKGAGIGQHQDGAFVAEPQVRGHLPETLRDHGGAEIWCKCLFQLLQQC